MKNRRIVYFLSALLIVVLMCGLIPSASAEGDMTCMCPCCSGMCRGGAAKASSAARPASPAVDELKPVRVETLTNFLTTALAAEEETDPAAREELLKEANLLWNDYIDLVIMPFMSTAEPAEAPAAVEPAVDVLKPVRVETLTNFLTAAHAAEEETDPAAREELLAEANLLWNDYLDLVIMPFMSYEIPQTESDIYLDNWQDPYCDTEDPYCGAEDSYADQYQQHEIGSTAQQPLMIGLPNPWTETESLEEAIRISGIAFDPPAAEALPAGMELFFYRAMPGTIEADYSNGKDELTIRVSMDENGYYLAGDYNTYSHEWQENIKGLKVDCLGDGKNANVAVFSAGDLAFALGSACGREGAGISEDALKSLIMGMQAVPTACEENKEDISASAEPDVYADPQPQRNPSLVQEKPEPEKNGETMILFTGGVHAAIDNGFGYAGLKALRDSLEEQGYTTVLVDNGDAVRGDEAGEASKGRAVIDLMNAVGYDLAIPGCDEFSFGVDQFFELGRIADFPYISCNYTVDGEPALPLCAMVELDNGTNIAFVGVTAPSAIAGDAQQSAEDLWSTVQDAVDIARAAGADLVYGMGHLGEDENGRPWTASDLIKNTTGIDIFLDGHGDDDEQLFVMNKEGEPVILSGCGSWFNRIGFSRISVDGEIVETGLWAWPNELSARVFFGFDNDVSEMAEAIRQKTIDELNAPVTVPDAAFTDQAITNEFIIDGHDDPGMEACAEPDGQESAVVTEEAPGETEIGAPAYLVF